MEQKNIGNKQGVAYEKVMKSNMVKVLIHSIKIGKIRW